MVYDVKWFIYLIVSFVLTIGILILLHYTVKKEENKETWLKIFAILTLLSHVSIYYYNYILKKGEAGISTFFPIYPCNVSMMLFPFVFLFNKKTKYFLIVFLSYYGIFGGVITLFEPSAFYSGGDIFAWGTMKSFLSHSLLLLTSLYAFSSGFIKIHIKDAVFFTLGIFGIFLPIGLVLNYVLVKNGHDPNAMYLRRLPIEGVSFLNPYMITFLMIIIVIIFITAYELITKASDERWYNKFKTLIQNKFTNKKKSKFNS